jgi:predicted AAA+ superfamily ATPase
MNSTATALTALFNSIPRRHSIENVKDINSIVTEYQSILLNIEAINTFYEKNIPVFFEDLDIIRATLKKSTDNKASKKSKDSLFDEASGILKDTIQNLISLYEDGNRTT